jgi:aminopeptidase YwaD
VNSRRVPLALTLALLTGSFGVIPAQADRILEKFSNDRAMDHVRKLARDIGVRVRTTRGERRAARYIASEFESMGYRVSIQKFGVDVGRSRNVIAWWPDARRFPLIVGAHMDSVPDSPGANDNASGIGVMLETARLLAGESQAKFVRFIAFGSEEYGADGTSRVGSSTYVHRLSDRGRRRMAGMISVDMIADGRPIYTGTAGIGPEVLGRMLFRKIEAAGIDVAWGNLGDRTDNGPFERVGIPGAFLWSGNEPDYHRSSDTVANMSKADLYRTGRALRAFLKTLKFSTIKRLRER